MNLNLFTSTKKYLGLSLMLLFTVFLSACKATEEVAEPLVVPPTPVSVGNLNETPSYTLKEVGVVKPFQEVEVVAQSSGIVGELNVKVGDTVNVDQVLGKIDQAENDIASINLSNAQNQLNNAKKGYDEGIANNQNIVTQAKLRAENLENSIVRMQRNLQELKSGNISSQTSLELQINNAQQNTQNAQIGFTSLEKQFNQSWENFLKSSEITFDGLFLSSNSYYQTAGSIINPEQNEPLSSSDFNALLGTQSNNQRNKVINLYNELNTTLKQEKKKFNDSLPLQSNYFQSTLSGVKEVSDLSRELNEAMRILLQNTQSSQTLSQAALDAYKAQVATAEAGSLQDQNTLNLVEKNYKDLQLQQNTQLSTAENSLSIAKNQQSDTQNGLKQFGVSSAGSVQDLEAQIVTTKNDLANAYLDYENTLRNTQVQNSGKQLEIQTYENQVKLAQKGLDDSNLIAPIQGTVSEVFIDQGDHVNLGTQVVKINQQNQVKVVFYVTEKQARWLKVGQSVTAKVNDGQDTSLLGRLIQIAPTADAQSHKVKVEASFEKELLRPEMFVSVEVEVSEAVFSANKFYVPLNAVVFGQNSQSLFVIENDSAGNPIAKKKEIQTGQIIDKWVEVLNGLNSTDQVIFEGSRGLEEGEEVSVS